MKVEHEEVIALNRRYRRGTAVRCPPAHAQSDLSSSGSPTVTTPAAPPGPIEDITRSEFAAEVIGLNNHHRTVAGVGPVQADETLMANSRAWSEVMAGTETFEHSYRWNVAQHLAWGSDAEASAEEIMNM